MSTAPLPLVGNGMHLKASSINGAIFWKWEICRRIVRSSLLIGDAHDDAFTYPNNIFRPTPPGVSRASFHFGCLGQNSPSWPNRLLPRTVLLLVITVNQDCMPAFAFLTCISARRKRRANPCVFAQNTAQSRNNPVCGRACFPKTARNRATDPDFFL
jgi:hypothetical protein